MGLLRCYSSKVLSLCCEGWISHLKACGCYVPRQTPFPYGKWPSAQCIKYSSAEGVIININGVTGCATNPLLTLLLKALQQPYTSLWVDTWDNNSCGLSGAHTPSFTASWVSCWLPLSVEWVFRQLMENQEYLCGTWEVHIYTWIEGFVLNFQSQAFLKDKWVWWWDGKDNYSRGKVFPARLWQWLRRNEELQGWLLWLC